MRVWRTPACGARSSSSARQRAMAFMQAVHRRPRIDAWIAEGAGLDEEAFARLVVERG
jgi:hypothetical protein